MSALIIVDISMILIRSTLMMFFCNFVMMWLILLLRLLCFHKKKENEGKYFPQYSVYTQPVQLFVFVWFFCLYGVKILALFQSKGPQKEKRMAKNNIMYTIDIISMLHFFCHPQLIQSGYVCDFINLLTLWNTFGSNPLCHRQFSPS